MPDKELSREEFEKWAKEKVLTLLEPDPNHPDDDYFMLHFPRGCDLVEGRDFWARNLADLLVECAWEAANKFYAAASGEALRWIPCDEKLPEKSWNYLVNTRDRGVEEAVYFADDKSWKTVAVHGWDSEQEDLYNVTHWMPLPAAPDSRTSTEEK